MRTEIASELKSLRLYGMASAWDELLGQGETAALQSARWLLECCRRLKTDPLRGHGGCG